MIKKLALTLALTVAAVTANATPFVQSLNNVLFADAGTRGPSWKVGDTASYNLNVSFISGSMVMTVKSVTADDLVIQQDLDLGAAGKQSCQVELDPRNGQTKKLTCNGQDQKPPAAGDQKVIETKEDKVTVPAGTFDCVYLKVQTVSSGDVTEEWANAQIPVASMVKTLAPSQLGQVTVELKSYQKQP